MFVLGIIVGRGTAPVKFDIEKLQKELAALREAVIKQELKRFKIVPDAGEKKPDLDFHEALKKPKNDIGFLPDISKHKKKALSEKSVSGYETKTKSQHTSEASQKDVSAGLTPQAAIKGYFTIQVLSVKDRKSADSAVAKLKKRGYPAYRAIGKVPGKGIYYRVRIGSFKSRGEASGILNRLKKEKYRPILILR